MFLKKLDKWQQFSQSSNQSEKHLDNVLGIVHEKSKVIVWLRKEIVMAIEEKKTHTSLQYKRTYNTEFKAVSTNMQVTTLRYMLLVGVGSI